MQPELAAALLAAQKEFTTVPKTRTATVQMRSGGKYTYKYSDFSDISAMALPILHKHGILFSQPTSRTQDNRLLVRTVLTHVSGAETASTGIAVPENLSPQELGTHMTYFRRYDATALLGIVSDEDVDVQKVDKVLVVSDSDMPSSTEKAAIVKHLKSYGVDSEMLKKFVSSFTGVAQANLWKEIGKSRWEKVFTALDKPGTKEGLEELLASVV